MHRPVGKFDLDHAIHPYLNRRCLADEVLRVEYPIDLQDQTIAQIAI